MKSNGYIAKVSSFTASWNEESNSVKGAMESVHKIVDELAPDWISVGWSVRDRNGNVIKSGWGFGGNHRLHFNKK